MGIDIVSPGAHMPFTCGDLVTERYQLRRQLSRNGARETWLVNDQKSGLDWVLKFLYFGGDTDWKDLKLLEREAKTLQTLQHPGIPRYSNAFWMERAEGHYFCLLQQFIPGVTLAAQLKRGIRYSAQEMEQLTRSMLNILEYLHAQSPPVIHRDIKPSNILSGADGKFYLIDFGAVQAQVAGRGTMTVVGTFGYMPPEQFAAQSVPASDLYGLGATLLHLATGIDPAEMPRRGMRLQIPKQFPLDSAWKQWLTHLIEPEVERRLASASIALKEFDQRNNLPVLHDVKNEPMTMYMSLKANDESNPLQEIALTIGGLFAMIGFIAIVVIVSIFILPMFRHY